MEGVTNDKDVSPNSQPRLLRFTVDGRSCYAMKWHDELTENRREVNYTIREAGEEVILCLLANCPLRITGTPDVVSVTFTGQKFNRAETEWERAIIVWEGGETDDEGLVRLCSPDVFRGRGAYLRQDLKRMVREYRFGTRKCHNLTPSSPAAVDQSSADVGRIEKRLDVLAVAMQQAVVSKAGTPSPVTDATLRREFAPVVVAVTKAVNTWHEAAPHLAEDRVHAQLAWIRRTENVSEVEREAAKLATDPRLSYNEIARRLPLKTGKPPMTREGVRKALLRFERKTGRLGIFTRSTYRVQAVIDADERQKKDRDNLGRGADEND